MKTSMVFTTHGITAIENEKNCKFVGDFCLKNAAGEWVNSPAAIFYQPNPQAGHTNYMGAFPVPTGDGLLLVNGSSAVSDPIVAVQAGNELIYSAYRHHFSSTKNDEWYIDGGRDYVKTNAPDHMLRYIDIVDGEFVVRDFITPNAAPVREVPLCGWAKPDTSKGRCVGLGECGCGFGQCARGMVF